MEILGWLMILVPFVIMLTWMAADIGIKPVILFILGTTVFLIWTTVALDFIAHGELKVFWQVLDTLMPQ